MRQNYVVMGFVLGAAKFAVQSLFFAYSVDLLFDWYNINAHMNFSSAALILICVHIVKNV